MFSWVRYGKTLDGEMEMERRYDGLMLFFLGNMANSSLRSWRRPKYGTLVCSRQLFQVMLAL